MGDRISGKQYRPNITIQEPSRSPKYKKYILIISPNKVFGDIMVLASPPPRPPVDPDDVNTLNSQNIQWISFKVYIRVDTPLRYVAIEI